MLRITCPFCGGALSASESLVGQRVQCGHCNETFEVSPVTIQSTGEPSIRSRQEPEASPVPEQRMRYAAPPIQYQPRGGNVPVWAAVLIVIAVVLFLVGKFLLDERRDELDWQAHIAERNYREVSGGRR